MVNEKRGRRKRGKNEEKVVEKETGTKKNTTKGGEGDRKEVHVTLF